MIGLSDGMTSGQAKEELRLEEFQRKFQELDDWTKELHRSIRRGSLDDTKQALLGLLAEGTRLSDEGAFKDEGKS